MALEEQKSCGNWKSWALLLFLGQWVKRVENGAISEVTNSQIRPLPMELDGPNLSLEAFSPDVVFFPLPSGLRDVSPKL